MASLNDELAAFARMQGELEADNMGKWVLVHGGALAGVFDTFEQAAERAVIEVVS